MHSNYGGWAGSAGIGAGRVNKFNTLLQSTKFDTQGEYIRTWVPELAKVPDDFIHDPWNMPAQVAKKVGAVYPMPIPCEKYTGPEAAKKIKRTSGVKYEGLTNARKKK